MFKYMLLLRIYNWVDAAQFSGGQFIKSSFIRMETNKNKNWAIDTCAI